MKPIKLRAKNVFVQQSESTDDRLATTVKARKMAIFHIVNQWFITGEESGESAVYSRLIRFNVHLMSILHPTFTNSVMNSRA
jgi:hypothetical protein